MLPSAHLIPFSLPYSPSPSPQIADYLFDPMCRGIFAGRSDQLSVRSCFPQLYECERDSGSVVRGMLFGKKGVCVCVYVIVRPRVAIQPSFPYFDVNITQTRTHTHTHARTQTHTHTNTHTHTHTHLLRSKARQPSWPGTACTQREVVHLLLQKWHPRTH